jgi:hypothetical protein
VQHTLNEDVTPETTQIKVLLERCKQTAETIATFTTLSDSLVRYLDDCCGDSSDVISDRNDVTRRYQVTCSKLDVRMLEVEQVKQNDLKLKDDFLTFEQGVIEAQEKYMEATSTLPQDAVEAKQLSDTLNHMLCQLLTKKQTLQHNTCCNTQQQQQHHEDEVKSKMVACDDLVKKVVGSKCDVVNVVIGDEKTSLSEKVDHIEGELCAVQHKMEPLQHVSLEYAHCASQAEQIKSICEEVLLLEPLCAKLIKESKNTEESEQLQKHLDEVLQSTEQQNNTITTLLPLTRHTDTTSHKFVRCVQHVEGEVEEMKLNQHVLPFTVKELEDYVAKCSPVEQKFVESHKQLLKTCEDLNMTTNTSTVEQHLHDTCERWQDVKTSLEEVKRGVDLRVVEKGRCDEAKMVVEESLEALDELLTEEAPVCFDVGVLESTLGDPDPTIDTLKQGESSVSRLKKTIYQSSSIDEADHLDDVISEWNTKKQKVSRKESQDRSDIKDMLHFIKCTNDLEAWVDRVAADAATIQSSPVSCEATREELSKIESMQEEIPKQLIDLHMCKELGEKLCEEMQENQQFCAHIENRLSKIEHPMKSISSTLNEDVNTLYSVLMEQQPLDGMVGELNLQLSKVASKMGLQKPLNVMWDVLELQLSQQHIVNDKISLVKSLRTKLEEAGRESLNQLDESKRVAVDMKMKESFEKCDELVKSSEKRSRRMKQVCEESKHFDTLCEEVIEWLDSCEKQLKELDTAPTTIKDAGLLLEGLFSLEQSMNDKQSTYEQCILASTSLLDTCRTQNITQGTNEVESHVQTLTERLLRVHKQVTKEVGCAGRFKSLMCTHREQKERLQCGLYELEDGLRKMTAFGTDVKKMNVEMVRLKEMSSKSEAMESELKNFCSTIGDLSSILLEKGKDVEHLTKEEGVVSEQVKGMNTRVVKRNDELERLVRVCTHFNEITQEVEEWCEKEAKPIISTMVVESKTSPCMLDQDEVKTQHIETVEGALEDLSHQKATLVVAEESGKWLRESCPGDLNLSSHVHTTLNKLKSEISSTEEQLTDTKTLLETSLIRSQDFEKLFAEVSTQLSSAELQLTRHKPVSADWSEVSAQLEEEKGHLKEIESLKRLVHSLSTSCNDNNRSHEDKAKVEGLEVRMEDVSSKQVVHVNTLSAVETQAHKVYEQLQHLNQRIAEAEGTSKHVHAVPTTPEHLKQQQKHLKPFFKSLKKNPKKNQQLVKELEKLKQIIQLTVSSRDDVITVSGVDDVTDHVT